MAFDRSLIAPAAQAQYIRIGENFGTDEVLAQINRTTTALSSFGTVVGEHGFGPPLVTLLADVREAMNLAQDEREGALVDKKVTNNALLLAMFAGKGIRLTTRAALSGAAFQLMLQGKVDEANAIEATLQRTRTAGADAKVLREQLMLLDKLFDDEAIRGATANAESLRTTLTTRAAALDTASQVKSAPLGTPEETEYVNLLDGLGVELVRIARRAARAAARELGQPAIAKAFELNELYRSTGRRDPDEDETGEGDADPASA